MKKRIIKKGFSLTIIVLFFGMSITHSTGTVVEKSSVLSYGVKTLYVGGSGPGNYSTINDAYDAAYTGDTIFVYSGTYHEYLHIKKTINLIGEDKETTKMIYSNKYSPVILIFSSFVMISGFTFYHPHPSLIVYVDISPGAYYTSISDCIFYNSPLHFDDLSVGICVLNSRFNRISNCTFLYNDDEGICLNEMSTHNTVENCVFSNCCVGIEFRNSSFNFIDNCTMENCDDGIAMLLANYPCNNNIITNCKFFNNNEGGVYLTTSFNNVIYNCSMINNHIFGFCILGDGHNNIVANCKIHGTEDIFGGGIVMYGPAHNNTIKNNDIRYHYAKGFLLEHTGYDNHIYHNNIIDNDQNAYDECNNIWDNGYPSGGNYWDDYTGVDSDGDGIGDTPYNITGGDNKDYYPLMDPWVKEDITVGTNGPFYGIINEPFQFRGVAVGGYKPYSWFWDFGDGETSDEQHHVHAYTEAGRYDVVLTVTDSHSNSSSGTTFSWIQNSNSPPSSPDIIGPTQGKKGEIYEYKFVSIDPEGNDVWYYIDWNDYTQEKWIGPYPSGVEITISHSWIKKGTYTIKAKCKDWYNANSQWSYLDVNIPRNRMINNAFLLRLKEKFPNAFPILRYIFGLR